MRRAGGRGDAVKDPQKSVLATPEWNAMSKSREIYFKDELDTAG